MLSVITTIITLCVMLFAIWNFKKNAKEKPQSTVIITLAVFVFLILVLMVLKTYNDYQLYISVTQHSANIGFALITDFFVLIIGICILYLNNFMFLNSVKEEKDIRNLYQIQKDLFQKKKKGDKKKSP